MMRRLTGGPSCDSSETKEMSRSGWDDRYDYLVHTRSIFFNDDYLSFYFTRVVKLKGPTRIIDFGCGHGYLGMQMARIMEEGIQYSGIDLSDELLSKAREIFADKGDTFAFTKADAGRYKAPVKSDLAICQALLMHCADPKAVLLNMKDNVRDGGYVVCIEPDWNASMAATHLSGLKSTDFTDLGILQKLFENDHGRSGKDGNIGIKVPLYMEEIGLKEIECRKNDKVTFVSPKMTSGTKSSVLKAFRENGFGRTIADEQSFMDDLQQRGLSRQEAARELVVEKTLNSYFNERENDLYFFFSPNMFISSGRVL